MIECGYRADRSEVARFLIAVQKAHHPQGKTFLMDALYEPTSRGDPFTKTSSNPQIESKWRDFPAFDDAKFAAAISDPNLSGVHD